MDTITENIALLIDADNSPCKRIDFVLAELAKYGVVNIRRAYGNWKSPTLTGWEAVLHDYAIRPMQQFDYTKGKNATDMAMTIDAMDLLYSQKLEAFCIVSSDSDFTPLVMRILANGLKVYGFGQQTTPKPFVNACSKFLYFDSLETDATTKSNGTKKRTSQELKRDTKLVALLRNAVESVQEDDGWSLLAHVGQHIANQASFDPRNYGYTRLGDLIRVIDLFDTERRNNNSQLYLRDKRTHKSATTAQEQNDPHQ
jgi:uncharacterized LabA/DUF88 family protein